MSDNFWEATQHALQGERPLVKRPKLTEALLKKPPFRFLHDVISEVQRNTAFAAGLYSDTELDAKAIQDKESKMAYLQKMIDFVSSALGEQVPAKPAKIVAGLEPELTNQFLLMLARAAAGSTPQSVQSSQASAAAQVMPGLSDSVQPLASSSAMQQDAAQATTLSPEQQTYSTDMQGAAQQATNSQAGAAQASSNQHRQSESAPLPALSPPDQSAASMSATSHQHRPTRHAPQQPDAQGTPSATAVDSQREAGQAAAASETRQLSEPGPSGMASQLSEAGPAGMAAPPVQRPLASRPERPTSARRGPPKLPQAGSAAGRPQTPSNGTCRPGTSSGRAGTALRQSLPSAPAAQTQQEATTSSSEAPTGARQTITSARAGLPLLPGARPASAGLKRPASAAGRQASVALIEEGAEQKDDTDVLVVTEALPSTARSAAQGTSGQGALVRNILEAEKTLQEQASEDGTVGEQQGTGIVLRRKKKSDSSSPTKAGDALAIADLVQKLCQSTNPLAKCMEHLQEDVETMAAELAFWADERKRYQDKLAKQQLADDVAEHQGKLSDLDSQAEAAEQRILSLKKTVLQNDTIIKRLIRMSVGAN